MSAIRMESVAAKQVYSKVDLAGFSSFYWNAEKFSHISCTDIRGAGHSLSCTSGSELLKL